jgi:hypothetical protein
VFTNNQYGSSFLRARRSGTGERFAIVYPKWPERDAAPAREVAEVSARLYDSVDWSFQRRIAGHGISCGPRVGPNVAKERASAR